MSRLKSYLGGSFFFVLVLSIATSPALFAQPGGGGGNGGGRGGGGKDDGPVFACPENADFDAFAFVIHEGNKEAYVATFGVDLSSGMESLTGLSQSFEVERPQSLTFHPTLPILYVADRTGGPLYVYDVSLGADGCPVLGSATIVPNDLGGGSDVEVHPDGVHLYVSGRGTDGSGGLGVFSLNQNGAIDAFTPYLEGEPFMRLDIAPDGNDVYLAADNVTAPDPCSDPFSATCTGIDSIVRQPIVDGVPSGDASRLPLSHFADGSVRGDQRARGVAVDDSRVFVAAFFSNTIWSCDRDLNSCTDEVVSPTILAPWGLALDASNLYVASFGEFAKGKMQQEGVSLLDPTFLSDPIGPVEDAGAARAVVRFDDVVHGEFLLASDFRDGSVSLLRADLSPLDMAVDTGDGNAREVVVIPKGRLSLTP